MSREENEQLYLRFLEILSSGDLSPLRSIINPEVFREQCVEVTPGWVGATEAQAAFSVLHEGIPDLVIKSQELYVDGDHVIGRIVGTGIHSQPLFGFPPTGNCVSFEGVDIVRIEDGKIVERWLLPDMLAMMRGIGALPVQA
jgi:predicted ester cyclase